MKLSQNFGLGEIMTRVSQALAVCSDKARQYMWFSIQIRQSHQVKPVLSCPVKTILTARTTSEKIVARPGSDFMVDVIKATGIEYIASNPGSSFRSLQESIVNYGDNKKPEFLTCMHEESSVAMAHGYAKAAGKPMGMMAHGTVGLQHATMAVYNAWCRSEEHTSELQSRENLVCRLL